MNEKETEDHQAHYNLFIEYIRKTDMMQGSYYMHMYNSYTEVQYCFDEYLPIKNDKETVAAATDGVVND